MTTVDSVKKEHGLRHITKTWPQYVQPGPGGVQAQNLVVFIRPDHLAIAPTPYAVIPLNLADGQIGTYTFANAFRGDPIRVGVAAGRYSLNGLVNGPISSPVPLALIAKEYPNELVTAAPNLTDTVTFKYWDDALTTQTGGIHAPSGLTLGVDV